MKMSVLGWTEVRDSNHDLVVFILDAEKQDRPALW